jgi:hypothetical protein
MYHRKNGIQKYFIAGTNSHFDKATEISVALYIPLFEAIAPPGYAGNLIILLGMPAISNMESTVLFRVNRYH